MIISILGCGDQNRDSGGRTLLIGEHISVETGEILPGTRTYRAIREGESLGAMTIRTQEIADTLRLEVHTEIQGMNIRQNSITNLNLDSFVPLSHIVKGSIGDSPIDIQLQWEKDHVTGNNLFPGNTIRQGAVDRVLPPGTLERFSVLALMQAFPMDTALITRFHWYNTLEEIVREVSVTISDGGALEVPAGSFPVFKAEIEGDDPAQILFISKDHPRKIVRIEVVGLPWRFDLVSEE